MDRTEHPNKPTCVIKAFRTAAALPRFSELKQTFARLENLFVPHQRAESLCINEDEAVAAKYDLPLFNTKPGSLMNEQPRASSAPNLPPIPHLQRRLLHRVGGPTTQEPFQT